MLPSSLASATTATEGSDRGFAEIEMFDENSERESEDMDDPCLSSFQCGSRCDRSCGNKWERKVCTEIIYHHD